MQKFSIKSVIFSSAIILSVIAFWAMQIQVLNQKTASFNLLMPAHKSIFLGEASKQLFSLNESQISSNVNLVGIIQNIHNSDKSYIILNIDGKNSIYRIRQELPNLGKLTAINKQDINFEKQGNIQKLFISQTKASSSNNDINYANNAVNGILPQPPNNLPEPIIYGAETNNPNIINNQAMDNYAQQPNQPVPAVLNQNQSNEGVAQPSIQSQPAMLPQNHANPN